MIKWIKRENLIASNDPINIKYVSFRTKTGPVSYFMEIIKIVFYWLFHEVQN